jgi:hypothetical protein
MKYLFLALVLIACCPKKPEQPKVVENNTETITIIAGSCYRYPNSNQEDVHMKVIKTYDKGGFFAEFIVNQEYFTDVHEFPKGTNHVKEIDCYMFDDLKSLSKPWEK